MTLSFKKFTATILIALTTLVSFANCFGSFPVSSKTKSWVASISLGNKWISKILRTIIMYIGMSLAMILDLIIFNLIEFWTDKVIVQNFNYDKNGVFVKKEHKGDELVTFTYSEFGKVLTIEIKKGEKLQSIVFLKDKPGKMFKKSGNEYHEITTATETIGSKTIMKLMSNNKLIQTKIMDETDVRFMEANTGIQL